MVLYQTNKCFIELWLYIRKISESILMLTSYTEKWFWRRSLKQSSALYIFQAKTTLGTAISCDKIFTICLITKLNLILKMTYFIWNSGYHISDIVIINLMPHMHTNLIFSGNLMVYNILVTSIIIIEKYNNV